MVTRVLIMAGGTGGHVFPALAVAERLRNQGVEVVWMGTRQGLEADIVPQAGFAMEWVSVSGLRGKGWLSWLLAPLRLSQAMLQALVILMRCRPMAVLGMGGFVSGPGGLMAWLLKRPLLIHEQNAAAGLTNRLLARLADRVMQGFPKALPERFHPQLTGNPVREDIAALAAPEKRYAARQDSLRLLVLGGSLGAQVLNEVVPQMLTLLPSAMAIQVWHQAGRRNIDAARAAYADCGSDVNKGETGKGDDSQRNGVSDDDIKLVPFIDDMAAAYGWADLVLCRAGALTVAELAAAGVAAILVPYPYAVDDHQTRNAAWLADAGAAIRVPQSQLTAVWLADQVIDLWTVNDAALNDIKGDTKRDTSDDEVMAERQQLLHMAQQARALARVDAAEQVATACLEVAHGG